MLYTKCPHCNSVLVVPEEYENDTQLHCEICNNDFEFTSIFKQVDAKKHKIEDYIPKIIGVLIIFAVFYGFYWCSEGSISDDGKTVYIITKDLYAPKTEQGARALTKSAVKNQHDNVGFLEDMVGVESSYGMTHLFKGDRVVVVEKNAYGYRVKKLATYETAIVINESYLKKE